MSSVPPPGFADPDELRPSEVRRAAEKFADYDLLRDEERFRVLVDAVKDYAIFLLDPKGRIVSWNAGARRLLGYDETSIVGKNCSLLFVPEDRQRGRPEQALRVAERQGRSEEEAWRLRRDGVRVWTNVVTTPVVNADQTLVGFAKVVRDLTERRQSEDALRRAHEKLEIRVAERTEQLREANERVRQAQKMEAVGRLAGGVAHDFNNLLSVVLSYAELASEGLKPGDPLREDLGEIQRAAQRAVALTRQLLAFSRQQVLDPQLLDLNKTMLGMQKMLARLIGEDIKLSLSPGRSIGWVHVDPVQIEQVLMNLGVNARDAMPNGGQLTIATGKVVLDAREAEPMGLRPALYVMLSVTDNGLGMDAATQARIFEPFFTTKERDKGTGLGLSTVLGIVQQSGGGVSVVSEPGKGTTLRVYLPSTERVEAARAASLPDAAPNVGGTETILLVEDDDQVRTIARAILRRAGYNVLEAQNGGEALLVCEQHSGPIQLLLSDVVMPRMNGRQVADRLSSLRPDMRVLFMSGYTDQVNIDPAVDAMLAKPITPASLLAKVRQVLDGRGRSAPIISPA